MKDNLLVENFLEMISAERDASLNTISAYRKDLLDLIKYLNTKNLGLLTASYSNLEDYITYLGTELQISSRSISRKISTYRQFFQFLSVEGIRNDNPCLNLSLPKTTLSIPKALTKEQIDNLLLTAQQDQTHEGLRARVMLEILYSSGLRITELITLTLDSLPTNFKEVNETSYMIIKGKGGKERVIILNIEAVQSLQAYLKVRTKLHKSLVSSRWLFPSSDKKGKATHITRQRFGQILKQLAINAGLNPTLVSPHKIRHSFATHMMQNGANLRMIQELLGHSDISTTQVYTQVLKEEAAKKLMAMHPLNQDKAS